METVIGKSYLIKDVSSDDTGIFFPEQTPDSIIEAVQYFEQAENLFNQDKIRQNSLRFQTEIFKEKIKAFVDEVTAKHFTN